MSIEEKLREFNSICDDRCAGMIIDVKGEDNVWKSRPCVFILNHQSLVDSVIALKIIKRDAIAIAKEEVKNIMGFGEILQAIGTIFIDIHNQDKAVQALQPAVDALKKETSVVIFPEGKLINDGLGPFKKGAFHMAIQAGVPIVPIIIKNSRDICPLGSMSVKPGTVNVVVKEPISISDWTLDNMNDKIQEIRQIYLDEINQ